MAQKNLLERLGYFEGLAFLPIQYATVDMVASSFKQLPVRVKHCVDPHVELLRNVREGETF